jgi:hypothetical protein
MNTITLVLNDMEQQALCQLLDTALRQAGLNALDVVSHFRGRIAAAQATTQPAATPIAQMASAPLTPSET